MPNLRCEQCLISYPESHFGNRSKGIVCTTCKSGIKTRIAEVALADKAKEVAGKLADMSDVGVDPLGKLRDVMASVYDNFGGTSGYARFLHSVIMELASRKPMPASVGQLLLNLMKIHHAIEQTEEVISAREMTDEQLKRETELATVRLLVDSAADPAKKAMLKTLLGKHGYALEKSDPEELIGHVASLSSGEPDEDKQAT